MKSGNQILVLLLGAAALIQVGLAVNSSEVPSIEVTLSGGPESGSIQSGVQFPLSCSFVGRYNQKEWNSYVNFYHNDQEVGKFQAGFKRLERAAPQPIIHWISRDLIPGLNIFPEAEAEKFTVDNTTTPYTVTSSPYTTLVQPLSQKVASGYYECSVTLQDTKFHANRAVYYSRPLYFGDEAARGTYKYKTQNY